MEVLNEIIAYAIFTAGTIALISYSLMTGVLITVLYGRARSRKRIYRAYKDKG